ncbi:glycosyl hydrolase family 18 protein [Francisella sp. XLW-1]|uniref:glycosyl hydrolase family 18 protein n=1 Tax=Francisella sp. XLW-1 TaxID=2610887 RepID=UPI00168CCEF4|nr:glycosyl hydrolase family 18 protein [Francisella sp. XLW-1]
MKKIIGSLLFCGAAFAFGSNVDWPQKTKLGYVENLNYVSENYKTTPSYREMAENNYNVVVVSFLTVEGTNVGFFDNQWNYGGYAPYTDKQAFISAVDDFHNSRDGAKVLVSTGGWENQWKPDVSQVDLVANNIVNFLAEHHLDGIDFDLEKDANSSAELLQPVISKMKDLAQQRSSEFPYGFFVTAAPHLKKPIGWAGATAPFMDVVVLKDNQGHSLFDVVMPQAYNNDDLGEKTELDNFKYIKEELPNDVKIVILKPGNPAMEHSAVGYKHPSKLKPELQAIKDDQFVGVGFWTAAADKYTEDKSTRKWRMFDVFDID